MAPIRPDALLAETMGGTWAIAHPGQPADSYHTYGADGMDTLEVRHSFYPTDRTELIEDCGGPPPTVEGGQVGFRPRLGCWTPHRRPDDGPSLAGTAPLALTLTPSPAHLCAAAS